MPSGAVHAQQLLIDGCRKADRAHQRLVLIVVLWGQTRDARDIAIRRKAVFLISVEDRCPRFDRSLDFGFHDAYMAPRGETTSMNPISCIRDREKRAHCHVAAALQGTKATIGTTPSPKVARTLSTTSGTKSCNNCWSA